MSKTMSPKGPLGYWAFWGHFLDPRFIRWISALAERNDKSDVVGFAQLCRKQCAADLSVGYRPLLAFVEKRCCVLNHLKLNQNANTETNITSNGIFCAGIGPLQLGFVLVDCSILSRKRSTESISGQFWISYKFHTFDTQFLKSVYFSSFILNSFTNSRLTHIYICSVFHFNLFSINTALQVPLVHIKFIL